MGDQLYIYMYVIMEPNKMTCYRNKITNSYIKALKMTIVDTAIG